MDTKPDTFRQEYKEVTAETSAAILSVKVKAQELYDLIVAVDTPNYDQRQMALAKTNLEQSVMWAIKGMSA